MKQRLLTNWTFIRALYVVMGTLVTIQSIEPFQWFGVLFGAYFAAMGLFSFGCASGACFTSNSNTKPIQQTKAQIENVQFEEIKTK